MYDNLYTWRFTVLSQKLIDGEVDAIIFNLPTLPAWAPVVSTFNNLFATSSVTFEGVANDPEICCKLNVITVDPESDQLKFIGIVLFVSLTRLNEETESQLYDISDKLFTNVRLSVVLGYHNDVYV